MMGKKTKAVKKNNFKRFPRNRKIFYEIVLKLQSHDDLFIQTKKIVFSYICALFFLRSVILQTLIS